MRCRRSPRKGDPLGPCHHQSETVNSRLLRRSRYADPLNGVQTVVLTTSFRRRSHVPTCPIHGRKDSHNSGLVYRSACYTHRQVSERSQPE
jgi:hypothetical protein